MDDGFIMFPSITVCKSDMYDKYPDFLINFFDKKVLHPTVNIGTLKSWIHRHVWNRSQVFRRLSHKTYQGYKGYDCNTESGPSIGKPCSFPFVYPDCSVKKHMDNYCSQSNKSRTYHQCISRDGDGTRAWCSTKNYLNDTHIFAQWGFCSLDCIHQNRSNVDDSNIAIHKYNELWEEKVYYLIGENNQGHCHTYNPKYRSLPGHNGELYALLG